MQAFHLAPYVAVNYFRYAPAGIMPAVEGGKSDFAIVSIAVDGAEITHRFDLPFQRDALDILLTAVNVAYALGHTDRANRMLVRLGRPRLAGFAAGSRERQPRDRD